MPITDGMRRSLLIADTGFRLQRDDAHLARRRAELLKFLLVVENELLRMSYPGLVETEFGLKVEHQRKAAGHFEHVAVEFIIAPDRGLLRYRQFRVGDYPKR